MSLFEVQCSVEASEAAIGKLRREVEGLGDSVVVAGGGGACPTIWWLHVHTSDPEAALRAASAAGPIGRVLTSRLADSTNETWEVTGCSEQALEGRMLVWVGRIGLNSQYGPEVREYVVQAQSKAEGLALMINAAKTREVVLLREPGSPAEGLVAEATRLVRERRGEITLVVLPTKDEMDAGELLALHDQSLPLGAAIIRMLRLARN